MPIAQINPEAEAYPYLRSGMYGRDLESGHEAECKIVKWDHPAESIPDWQAEDGKTAEDFVDIQIKVFSTEYGIITLFRLEPITDNSGSRINKWLTALGINVSDNGSYDTDEVIDLDCVVEVGDPYQSGEKSANPGVWRSGNLRQIFAAE